MIYEKVQIKDRVPKTEGRYIVGFTIKHILPKGDQIFDYSFMADYSEQYSFHEEMTDCTGIEWWLDPVCIPSDREIADKAYQEWHNVHLTGELGFNDGAKWLLRKLSNRV